MSNTFIKEFRAPCPSTTEPNRTRLFVESLCEHCNEIYVVRKSSYKPTSTCPQCAKRLRGKANFFKRAEQKFGNKFDLVEAKTEYFDCLTPVTVRCVVHDHKYKIRPIHFVGNSYDNAPHKGGCAKCAVEASRKYLNKPITHYLQQLNDKFPNIKVHKVPTNTNSNMNPIELICPVHGVFTKTLADIVKLSPSSTSLCPTCSREKLAWNTRTTRTDIPGKVYLVHFEKENLYKCGVTYKTIEDRFKAVLSNITPIWIVELPTLEQAYQLEVALFRYYAKFRTTYPDTSFGGYTEFLTTAIAKPDERFIEEILCRKESNSGKTLPSKVEGNPERSLEDIQETCRD